MAAVPVIVGALGRVPLGALTDRYGGRRVFAAVSFLGVVPGVFLAFATGLLGAARRRPRPRRHGCLVRHGYLVRDRHPVRLTAAALTLVGLAFLLLGRDASGTPAAVESFAPGSPRLRATWKLAALYALTFGGFVVGGARGRRHPGLLAVELEGAPHVIVSELRRGRYVQVRTVRVGERATVEVPFPVSLDPAGPAPRP